MRFMNLLSIVGFIVKIIKFNLYICKIPLQYNKIN